MASRKQMKNHNKKKKRRTPEFLRSKNENRLGMISAFLAIIVMTVVVGISSINLRQKNAKYEARENELIQLIAQEDDRANELEELATYTKTKKYAEEVAKDKLGLVYEDEIIFQETN